MQTVEAGNPFRMKRREALQIGAGLFGLNLPGLLNAARAEGRKPSERCGIFLFRVGGRSHFETFDA